MRATDTVTHGGYARSIRCGGGFALLTVLIAINLAIPLAGAQSAEPIEGTWTCNGQEIQPTIQGNQATASCSAGSPVIALAVGGAATAILGAFAWTAWLRWLPAMGGFTRLRKDTLLDHPLRAHLHQLIEEEPGIHHQSLMARTGKANGHVSHHLSTMVRAGMIVTIRGARYSTYFVTGAVDAPVMEALTAVRSPTAAAVLRALADEPGVAMRHLARRLDRPESTIRHHCHKLARAGLVDGSRVLSAVGERVLIHIPEAIGRPKRPPGPMA